MNAQSAQQVKWDNLTQFVSEWFHGPDLDALRIALAVGQTSRYVDTDPVWLFVLGASGTGKTALIIKALSSFPNHRIMSDLTTSTFLSAKLKHKSFLYTCGENALLLFKDFTTLLCKRPDERLNITAQLREIHDGEWVKDTGEAGTQRWEGRLTIVAACTPALERAWAVMRDLGERFVNIRLLPVDVRPVTQAMRKQQGHRAEIKAGIVDRVQDLIAGASGQPASDVPSRYYDAMDSLAEIVARCRTHVVRLESGNKEIIDVGMPEVPTRLINGMQLVAIASADLAGREPGNEDIRLAARIAIDSIPSVRWRIIESLPEGAAVTCEEISAYTGVPQTTVRYHVAELRAIGVLSTNPKLREGVVEISPVFAELRSDALIWTPQLSPPHLYTNLS